MVNSRISQKKIANNLANLACYRFLLLLCRTIDASRIATIVVTATQITRQDDFASAAASPNGQTRSDPRQGTDLAMVAV
jgi:hypothetical protein